MLPIIAITQSADYNQGLLQGAADIDLDEYFARFKVIPGSTLVNNQIGQYPFANQTVAANAIIAQPLTISLEMICPPRNSGDIAAHLNVLTALQQAFAQHTSLGGYYVVATPSQIYPNCILLGVRDITSGENKLTGIHWQFDFVQPLLALSQQQTTYNSLLSIMANQLPPGTVPGITPAWSSGSTATNGNTLSGPIISPITSSNSLIAASTTSVNAQIGQTA
jgi:hypothetical protein